MRGNILVHKKSSVHMTLSIWIKHLIFYFVKNCQLLCEENKPN